MNELDRIYEEIENLLNEANGQVNVKNKKGSAPIPSDQELMTKGNNEGWTFLGTGFDGAKIFQNNQTQEKGYYSVEGTILPYDKQSAKNPHKIKTLPKVEKQPAAEEKAVAGGSLVPAGNRSITSQENKEPYVADYEIVAGEPGNGGVPATPEQLQKLEQETSPVMNSLIKNVPANTWEDGTWTTLCKKSNGYFYPKNNMIGNVQISVATRIRPQQDVTPIKPDEIQMRPDAYDKNSGQTYSIGKWYATAEYKDGKWNVVDPPRPAKLNQVTPSTKNLVSTGFEGSEAPDFWTSGQWKNQCDEGQDGYFYLKNNEGARVKALEPEKVLPEEGHLKLNGEDWYLVEKFEEGKWVPVKKTLLRDVPAQIPEPAAEVLNTDTQLNYRLKAVIDSPDIQKQIDASPNGINFVGLNNDKISLVTMAESSSYIKEFNIPDFISKFMEAKEHEISSLGAGGQTNLNVFLTPEIQNYLKTKKGNPTITKVMLGKDGLVWLMDDKNNPILLDDMGVNDEVPAKDQQGNSFSVFINNGGAGGANGGAVSGTAGNAAGITSNENEPYGEMTQLITRSELVSIKPQIQKKLNNIVDKVDLSSINEAIQKDGYQIEITKLQLSQAVKGTFLEDSKDWKQIKEASETEEKKKDKSEKTETVQTTTGDTEVYVIEEYVLKPIENQEEVQEVSESAESHFLDALRESQRLLREDVEPEEVSEGTVEEQDNDIQNEEEKLARKSQAIEIVPKVTSYSVASLLNEEGKVSLRIKTKDETTFTGNKKESISFSFSQGDSNKCGHKVIDEENGIYKGWFTITIIKGNPKESGGTKFNRFMNGLTGVANWVNKVQGSTTASQKQ